MLGLGFGVTGGSVNLGFRVSGFGFSLDLGSRVSGLGFRVSRRGDQVPFHIPRRQTVNEHRGLKFKGSAALAVWPFNSTEAMRHSHVSPSSSPSSSTIPHSSVLGMGQSTSPMTIDQVNFNFTNTMCLGLRIISGSASLRDAHGGSDTQEMHCPNVEVLRLCSQDELWLTTVNKITQLDVTSDAGVQAQLPEHKIMLQSMLEPSTIIGAEQHEIQPALVKWMGKGHIVQGRALGSKVSLQIDTFMNGVKPGDRTFRDGVLHVNEVSVRHTCVSELWYTVH